MKIVSVVGARPQIIKAAPLSVAIRAAGHTEFLLHTGQHYDYGLSQVFFDDLDLPEADINLDVRSGSHGKQTGLMLIGIEEVLLQQKPDWVIVFGDTNSTLAGALAAVKLGLRLAHVEAGLRSNNRLMPEEHNRVLTDHCADMLFCPTQLAVENLKREGIQNGVHLVGDLMYDAVLLFDQKAQQHSTILQSLGLGKNCYLLATVHRAVNTDHPENLIQILKALAALEEKVIFPLHPRTRQKIIEYGFSNQLSSHICFIEPVGYLDMLVLEKNARLILTDSGGVQKEAFIFGVPCLTLRAETEWVETVTSGWNLLVGTETSRILKGVHHSFPDHGAPPRLFGDGHSATSILHHLEMYVPG